MDEVIRGLSGGQFIGLVAVILGVLFVTLSSLASIIAPNWRKARQAEAEALLKRDLIAAGFSADEIERVVRATSSGRPSKACDRSHAFDG
ncbi:MAG TPA: hypothetical protein VM533_12240, partial [Fimbriiglobus sp.]|nr:hypothetical protein [Fimbriiglobus sp.]